MTLPWDSSVIKQTRKVADTPELDHKFNYRADRGVDDRERNYFSARWNALFFLSRVCKCRTVRRL